MAFWAGHMTDQTKSTNHRPTTHRTHTPIFTTLWAADYLLYIHFATKVAHPERPPSRSDDSSSLHSHGAHKGTDTPSHIFITHGTQRLSLSCCRLWPVTDLPRLPKPSSLTFPSLVSSFLAPKHDTPSIRMAQLFVLALSFFSLFCSQVQRGGGEAKYSFC